MFHSKNNYPGFTLIELLVVIAIIGLLATLSITSLGAARKHAHTNKAKSDLSNLAKALDLMAMDTGEWPGHQAPYVVCSGACDTNELEDLTTASAGLLSTDGSYANWSGPYMQSLTKDPWGHNYFFDNDYQIGGVNKAVVGSYGPNGAGLNLYDSDDILVIINH